VQRILPLLGTLQLQLDQRLVVSPLGLLQDDGGDGRPPVAFCLDVRQTGWHIEAPEVSDWRAVEGAIEGRLTLLGGRQPGAFVSGQAARPAGNVVGREAVLRGQLGQALG